MVFRRQGVVNQRQGMAAPLVDREVAFEVELQQLVWCVVLETDERLRFGAPVVRDQPLAMLDVGDGGGRRCRAQAARQEIIANLPPTPRRMRLDHRLHPSFHRRSRTAWRAPRPSRAILKAACSLSRKTGKPLVALRPANVEAPAQCADVRSLLACQHHELIPQRHGRHLAPGHDRSPVESRSAHSVRVSPMSPHDCNQCLRSKQWGGVGGGVKEQGNGKSSGTPMPQAPDGCEAGVKRRGMTALAPPTPSPSPQRGRGTCRRT